MALGPVLLALGAALATGRLPWRRKARALVAGGEPETRKKEIGDSSLQRALREPRLGVAVAVGVVVGLPGASYIAALHNLIAGKFSTGTQIVAVAIFAIIESC